MKKAFCIISALILTLLFSACAPNNDDITTAPTITSNAPTTTQPEPTTMPAAEDEYADLSHLSEAKKLFFQHLGFAPSSLHTAFSGSDFLSTAHRGVVSVYTGDLFGNDKTNEAIVVSLLDDGGMDRIQANYFYFGNKGLTTQILLSAPLYYGYSPNHQDPPRLFIYRHGGKTYFCCQKIGGNEYGGGSFGHYGFIYTEILPSGKTAHPVSLEYGHGAGYQWYAAVYEENKELSSSKDEYGEDGDYAQEVSFDAINAKLKEIGLPVLGSTREEVLLVDVNEKTPGVTMLVSGSVEGGWGDCIGTVEYIDHLKYD